MEEELPFNRKTAIFLLSSRFWENYNYKTVTQMVIPLKFVVVKISSEK